MEKIPILKLREFAFSKPRKDGRGYIKYYRYECSCGSIVYRQKCHVRPTSNCGCKPGNARHSIQYIKLGASRMPLYKTWKSMKDRCENPNHQSYYLYGGRGIRMAEEWKDFGLFCRDMQEEYIEHASQHRYTSLDRINNSLGYSKENCRWADRNVQANNRRTNVFFEFRGAKMKLRDIIEATQSDVDIEIVRNRIKRGWSIEDAISIKKTR